MKFSIFSLCAALACQSVSSFVPHHQRRPCAFSRGTSSGTSTGSFSQPHIAGTNKINKKQWFRNVRLQMASDEDGVVKADDGEALQALFAKNCDKDGLMTKEDLQSKISVIKELLDLGDLLQEELDDIWKAAPKFPDVNAGAKQRIDVDSFIQIYRDIDDIFEDDDSDEETSPEDDAPSNETEMEEDEDDDIDTEEAKDEQQLEEVFKTICDDAGLVTKAALKNWDEIQELLKDNELGEDEFDNMWERTTKSPGSTDMIDVEGFLSFNVALDDLFEVFDEDEEEEDGPAAAPQQIPMFYADDLPPGVIFAEIADDNFLVGMDELKKWGDLQDMMREGDLLPLELQNLYEGVAKASGTDKLNEEGFEALYEAIDSLFEDIDEDEEDSQDEVATVQQVSSKVELLDAIEKFGMDEERLPCGLDSTETEVELMLEIASKVEQESTNMITGETDVQTTDLAGTWELMYTTSSTMKFNKSLSGLVPPNGKFGGLIQTFKASKYLADVEYVEKINAGPASFEVKVTGDWELRNTVSLFTGARSVALNVEPDSVSYGITSQRADHWKSLGPMNLLDIMYLDEDIRIMRGTTSVESIFVFKRV